QHDLSYGAAVHCERLEELRSMTNRLWMLNYDPHCARGSAVCNLNPFDVLSELTSFRGEINTQSCDHIIRRVAVQLCHEQIIVFHSQWKFLHVCEKSDKKMPAKTLHYKSSVLLKTGIWNTFYLYLPVLSHRVPNTHFASAAQGHQLTTNEEEVVHQNM
ncbi:hypothetical protein EGW08_005697, partial [Elysia chlorotica]